MQLIESLYEEYNTIKEKIESPLGINFTDKNIDKKILKIITMAKTRTKNITWTQSVYYQDIERISKEKRSQEDKIQMIMWIVDWLYEDIKNGFLEEFKEIVHAEVFADFIEMSEHLNKQWYKDGAAVIVWSSLESHLRKLAEKHNIEIMERKKGKTKNKEAGAINEEIYQQEIYNKVQYKNIISRIEIRNNAAHWNYNEYTKEEVNLMIQGIKHFIIKNPA